MNDLEARVINQAISDFDGIKYALQAQGVEVPEGTDTSEYRDMILSIPRGGKVDQAYDPASVNAQSGIAVKEAIDGLHLKYVESTSDNVYDLFSLESGTYVLKGSFRPYPNAKRYFTFSKYMLVSVSKGSLSTCVQVFYPPYNTIQYLNIWADDSFADGYTYERKDAQLYYAEDTRNKTNTVDKNSDDAHYPSAKAVWGVAEKVERNSERIANVEAASTVEVIDDAVAYSKVVPENALPYAEITEIGGMTRKCTNLWEFGDCTFDEYTQFRLNKPLPAGQYTVSALISSSDTDGIKTSAMFLDETGASSEYAILNRDVYNSVTITTSTDTRFIRLYAGTVVSNSAGDSATWKNIMLNEGSTALPYEPYFEGLRSAPVSTVESVGANLLSYPYDDTTKTVNGVTFTDNGDGSITVNGTATADAVFNLSRVWIKAKQKYFASGCPLGGSQTTYYLLPRGFGRDIGNGILINGVSWDFSSLSQIVITSGTTVNNLVFKPMLNAGTTAKPYAPYFKRTLEIPEAVRALGGYGWSKYDEVYNYIDYEKKQFIKRVNKAVFDGSADEIWAAYTDADGIRGEGYCYAIRIEDRKSGSNTSICSRYNNVSWAWDKGKIGDYGDGIYDVNVYFISDIPTLSEFITNLSANPVELCYELATPEITDISDVLPTDNLIEVENGGMLTMVNEYGYDVPNTVKYRKTKIGNDYLLLASPDGTAYKVTVDNNGNLTAAKA